MTRELIDLAASLNGSYYLPYQPHGTYQQFSKIFQKKDKLFSLKSKLDPKFKLRNSLWEKYYTSYLEENKGLIDTPVQYSRNNEFKMIFEDHWHDKTYKFLQNIFGIQDCDKFFTLIKNIVLSNKEKSTEEIYNLISSNLNTISSVVSDNIRGLLSLRKQKEIMSNQVKNFNLNNISSYLEIGSTGRYIKGIKDSVNRKSGKINKVYLLNEIKPSMTIADIAERSSLFNKAEFMPLNNYQPINLKSDSLDLVTCFIGLHHIEEDKLHAFIKSISDSLKIGGYFILRDHDCETSDMKVFASLIHSIFNIGTKVDAIKNNLEIRCFEGLTFWINLLKQYNLIHEQAVQYQENDPSLNALMLFKKV